MLQQMSVDSACDIKDRLNIPPPAVELLQLRPAFYRKKGFFGKKEISEKAVCVINFKRMEAFRAFSITLLLDVFSGQKIPFDQKTDTMCRAIENLPEIFNFTSLSTLDFIFSSRNEKDLDKLRCFKPSIASNGFTILTRDLKQTRFKDNRKKNFIVMFTDSGNFLQTVLVASDFDIHGYFLIIFTSNSSEEELNSIFHLFSQTSVVNVNILVDTKKDTNKAVSMFTFFPFGGGKKCF